jgi:hypothetical protein
MYARNFGFAVVSAPEKNTFSMAQYRVAAIFPEHL